MSVLAYNTGAGRFKGPKGVDWRTDAREGRADGAPAIALARPRRAVNIGMCASARLPPLKGITDFQTILQIAKDIASGGADEMRTFTIASADASAILAKAVGAYVWGSRAGQDGVLRLDLGPPHLQVREPSHAAAAVGGTAQAILERRIVLPVGRWHLFVESGLWRVSVSGLACDRIEAEREAPPSFGSVTRCLSRLDGQTLTAAGPIDASGEWRFTFDLGGELSIRADMGGGSDPRDPVWTLFLEDDTNLSYMPNRTFALEQEQASIATDRPA